MPIFARNRLKNDPSLQIEKKRLDSICCLMSGRSDGAPLWEFPENPAEAVKKKLIRTAPGNSLKGDRRRISGLGVLVLQPRTYTKIKKSGHDMSIAGPASFA